MLARNLCLYVLLGLSLVVIMVPVNCVAVELYVSPSNTIIHVGEPIEYDLLVVNKGESAVSGVFAPINAGFAGLTVEISGPTKRAGYAFSQDETADDMFYSPTLLEPGASKKGTIRVLYDMRRNEFVFHEPGDYELKFDLRWDWSVESRPHANATVTVKVLEWDEKSFSSIEALSLWADRNVAYAYQCSGGVFQGESLKRLTRLKTEYGDTIYGQLAVILLERAQR